MKQIFGEFSDEFLRVKILTETGHSLKLADANQLIDRNKQDLFGHIGRGTMRHSVLQYNAKQNEMVLRVSSENAFKLRSSLCLGGVGEYTGRVVFRVVAEASTLIGL
eukprot:Lankesteria_metandrocarpae@DN3068_c0_g1_i1.p1